MMVHIEDDLVRKIRESYVKVRAEQAKYNAQAPELPRKKMSVEYQDAVNEFGFASALLAEAVVKATEVK